MLKHIYEHLKTRTKYNRLELKYDVKCEELERKSTELRIERNIWKKKQEIWEKTLKEQEEEIVKLKKRKARK